MTSQEIYDQYFIDEEYDLDNAPIDTYSYRSGWNEALKRAAIIMRKEIRPTGSWIDHIADRGYAECPFCHKEITGGDLNFCVKCGAKMTSKESDK